MYEVIEDAFYLQEFQGTGGMRDNSIDLIESFNALIEELKDSGFKSSDDFRGAGKGFCQNIDYGKEILLGFATASKHSGLPISRALKSFILGMKQKS